MKYTIAIVFRNAPDHLERCLKSIEDNSPMADVEVLLWDNGSDKGAFEGGAESVAFCFRHDMANECGYAVELFRSESNEGFGEPMNRMLMGSELDDWEGARGEYFVGLNSDCVVGPGWLDALVAPFEKYAMVGLTGPRGGCRQILPNGKGSPGSRLDYIEGSCFMIPTKLFREFGGFDTGTFKFAYAEDADLCLRLRQAGYKLCEVDVPGYEHERGVTRAAVLAEEGAPDLLGYETINNARLLTRWQDYLKRGTFARSIMVNRSGARGDVLWLTAMARIVARYRPHWRLYAHTPFPELFRGNPLIFPVEGPLRETVEVIDLDNAYEKRPHEHVSVAYAHALGIPGKLEPSGPQLFLEDEERAKVPIGRDVNNPTIIVHSSTIGWKGRDVPPKTWSAIVFSLAQAFPGHTVLSVGLNWPEDLRQSAALIAAADLFVGPSSFPLSLAWAVGTPTVGIFGSVSPSVWVPPKSRSIALQDHRFSCLGCHHEMPAPRQHTDCPREPDADYAPCMRNLDHAAVVEAAKEVIKK